MKKRINGKIIIIFLALLQTFFLSQALCADTPNDQRGIGIQVKDTETGMVHDVTLYRKMHAVIIGIDKYINLPLDKQLRYAVNDAKGVEKVLREKYSFDSFYTLYNEKATKSEILKILEGELSKIEEEDAVFV
ncbi:MAG: caspase family protein, partial [Nitrospirota bacterium]|nr:caspase family protein [Nitrospirota bacterium]